ncbi:MAG: hypothetical protein HQL75_15235 [Magnetococcales bacterium]|nr:hypothetical protein [Magnetococcales bacterium]
MSAGSWLESFILTVVLFLSLAFVVRRAARFFSAKKGGGCHCSGKSCCNAGGVAPQSQSDVHPGKTRYIPIAVVDDKKNGL